MRDAPASTGIENRDATPSTPRRPYRRRDLPPKPWARGTSLRRRSSDVSEHARSHWETTGPPPPPPRWEARLAPLAFRATDRLPKPRRAEPRPSQRIQPHEPAVFRPSVGREQVDGQVLWTLKLDRRPAARVRGARQNDRAHER